jgi:hypothetical protein
MLYEAGYDKIELYSASKGMNQNIAPNLLPLDYSYYIENIMPLSLGDGQVRYGNALFSEKPQDDIIDGFPFSAADGSKQQVLYFNGYNTFASASTLRIISSSTILLTSPDFALFQKDTWLKLQYRDNNGISPVSFYEIKNSGEDPALPLNTIIIEIAENSFSDALEGFYIAAPDSSNPQYIDDSNFSITIPEGFITSYYYEDGQSLKLVIDGVEYNLTIVSIDSDANTITFTTSGDVIPVFTDVNTRVLRYQSFTPEITSISNSSGYIKVLDVATDTLLAGEDQTIDDLSVTCVPRAEYFGKRLWIYNGVDPVMVWDGAKLSVYEEQVKEAASSFNRIVDHDDQFSFVCDATFDISKYAVGKRIRLLVFNGGDVTSAITAIIKVDNLVTITLEDDVPAFTGQNKLELFYFDRPPPFSYMKGANDRLWCLGEGAVGLDYRIPDLALRYYYSYKPYSDQTNFKFFNEKTKSVPSEDISAKHGEADNLEAIIDLSGKLVFMGRKKSQVWQGIDPLSPDSPNSFSWTSTIPVGVYHGNLIVDLPNDAQFLSQNGFVSFGTLNIAKQFAASNTANMDKLATEHINTIDSNINYRACRSFKYKNGGFCGFKVGKNSVIVSKYHTSFFWWGIFSGDFTSSSSFLSALDDSLYLFIGKKIYQYADGLSGTPILYADRNGERSVDFVETKYVNNINKRYSNRRYEIQADYSSSVVINPENNVNIYIAGDLTDTFILQNLYRFPLKGDVLGTINLVDGSTSGSDPNNPSGTSLGMRLDSPSHTKKDRLKFVSNNFSVTIAGSLKDGPFNLKRIRLFGVVER